MEIDRKKEKGRGERSETRWEEIDHKRSRRIALNDTEVSLNKFSSANPPARTIFPGNFAPSRGNHLTLVLMTGHRN